MIRVLYIAHMTERDGSSLCLLGLIDALSNAGVVEPHVVVPKASGFLVDELRRRRIDYVVVPLSFSTYPPISNVMDVVAYVPRIVRNIIRNCLAVHSVSMIATSKKIDVLHTNNSVIHVGYRVSKRLGLPHVWHVREFQGREFNMRPFPSEAALARALEANGVGTICTSNVVRQRLRAGGAASVIYDGVRSRSLCEELQPAEKKDNRFVFIGKLVKNKGLLDLLEAFAVFHRKYLSVRLLIVGDAPNNHEGRLFMSTIKSVIARERLSDVVELAGSRSDVDDILRSAIAVIIPSYFEGFGRVAPEAALNGCLVVGRDVSGTSEVLDCLGTGLRFNDVGELVCRMEEAYVGIGVRQMSEVARFNAMKYFLIEENSSKIAELYLRLVRGMSDA